MYTTTLCIDKDTSLKINRWMLFIISTDTFIAHSSPNVTLNTLLFQDFGLKNG